MRSGGYSYENEEKVRRGGYGYENEEEVRRGDTVTRTMSKKCVEVDTVTRTMRKKCVEGGTVTRTMRKKCVEVMQLRERGRSAYSLTFNIPRTMPVMLFLYFFIPFVYSAIFRSRVN